MENGHRRPPTSITVEITPCMACIFYDVCDSDGKLCGGYYSDGMDEMLQRIEDEERKIEYIADWETYTRDFR